MSYEIFERLCKEKNVTPAQVSRATGVATPTLSSWKNGSYTPKQEKLQKIASYFGVSLDYLATGSDPAIKTRGYDITDFEYQIILAYRKQETAAKEVVVRSLGLELPDQETERGKKEGTIENSKLSSSPKSADTSERSA